MDNFVNFLLDYYPWILGVLAIIIITIIGFLVDSRQKRKKKEKENVLNEVKTVEPLPEVNAQDATPVVDAKTQTIPTNNDNVIGVDTTSNVINQSQNIEQINGTQVSSENVLPQPENNNQNLSLSEQKPHFEPREVPMPNKPVEPENIVIEPQPVNAVPINQSIPVQQVQNNMAEQVNPVMYQQPQNLSSMTQNYQNVQGINTMPNQSNMQQPMYQYPNNNIAQPQMAYNNINTNQPVNYQNTIAPTPIPTPQQQPVGTIPNTQAYQMPTTPIQNQQPTVNPTPQQNTPNIGINFVTGANASNVENDDTWKL